MQLSLMLDKLSDFKNDTIFYLKKMSLVHCTQLHTVLQRSRNRMKRCTGSLFMRKGGEAYKIYMYMASASAALITMQLIFTLSWSSYVDGADRGASHWTRH
jgi:hypothetical protein